MFRKAEIELARQGGYESNLRSGTDVNDGNTDCTSRTQHGASQISFYEEGFD